MPTAHVRLLFREIIEIADNASGDYVTTGHGKRIVDHENINRSRLRVDARKWAAARLAPKKYGDRVEHDERGGGAAMPAVLIQIGSVDREDDAKLIEGDQSRKLARAGGAPRFGTIQGWPKDQPSFHARLRARETGCTGWGEPMPALRQRHFITLVSGAAAWPLAQMS